MGAVAIKRLYEEKQNKQGSLMKIVEYNNYDDIVVEFQDEHNARVHTAYGHFLNGSVKNPYYPTSYGVGKIGNKYPVSINCKATKEYAVWQGILRRCYDEDFKSKHPTYKNVSCCSEWLLFENFYEWLHSQENFEKWLNGGKWEWAVDKDILIKGNKVYSPNACCIVPQNVNQLFKKKYDEINDSLIYIDLQVCINKTGNDFKIKYKNPITNKTECFSSYKEIEKMHQIYKAQSFELYKIHKENTIKQVAKEEYDNGNITERCYNAMIAYEVDIND